MAKPAEEVKYKDVFHKRCFPEIPSLRLPSLQSQNLTHHEILHISLKGFPAVTLLDFII